MRGSMGNFLSTQFLQQFRERSEPHHIRDVFFKARFIVPPCNHKIGVNRVGKLGCSSPLGFPKILGDPVKAITQITDAVILASEIE